MRIFAIVATLAAGCDLYIEQEPETLGELELSSARNIAMPALWTERMAMAFEPEPVTRTITEFGSPQALPLPAPTSLRFDGRDDGRPLDLAGMFWELVEGSCTTTGVACSGPICFGEILQTETGVCSFSFRGATLAGPETAPRCYIVARFHGGTGTSEEDEAFRQLHIDGALAARERCVAALAER